MSAAQASCFALGAEADRDLFAGSVSAAVQQVSILLAAMTRENMETAVLMLPRAPHKHVLLHQPLMLSATDLLSCLLLQQVMATLLADMAQRNRDAALFMTVSSTARASRHVFTGHARTERACEREVSSKQVGVSFPARSSFICATQSQTSAALPDFLIHPSPPTLRLFFFFHDNHHFHHNTNQHIFSHALSHTAHPRPTTAMDQPDPTGQSFPQFADGDVRISLSGSRQYQLHSGVLKNSSSVMRELLSEDYAAQLNNAAHRRGVLIRHKLVLAENPYIDEEDQNLTYVLQAVPLDPNGRPVPGAPTGLGLELENGREPNPIVLAHDLVLGAFYNQPIDLGDSQ